MPRYLRPYFNHYDWVRGANANFGIFRTLCDYRHSIDRRELRKMDHDQLMQKVADLVHCADFLCPNPRCEATRGTKSFERLMATKDCMHRLIDRMGMVKSVGGAGIVGAGRSSTTTTVVQDLLPQEVHRNNVEEHIFQPPPIHETETRTWVHRGFASIWPKR